MTYKGTVQKSRKILILDYHQSIAHLKKAAQSLDFLKKFKVLYKI
jgi:hypothetical protein